MLVGVFPEVLASVSPLPKGVLVLCGVLREEVSGPMLPSGVIGAAKSLGENGSPGLQPGSGRTIPAEPPKGGLGCWSGWELVAVAVTVVAGWYQDGGLAPGRAGKGGSILVGWGGRGA